jgi:hypothetical protein
VRSDSDIKRDVEDELRWTPDLDPTDIGVAVKNGVVTLTGFVRSYSQKYEAEKAAKRVVGVLGLANGLEVRLVGIPHARIATSGDPCSAKTDASQETGGRGIQIADASILG